MISPLRHDYSITKHKWTQQKKTRLTHPNTLNDTFLFWGTVKAHWQRGAVRGNLDAMKIDGSIDTLATMDTTNLNG